MFLKLFWALDGRYLLVWNHSVSTPRKLGSYRKCTPIPAYNIPPMDPSSMSIHTILAWRNKVFGPANNFVWASDMCWRLSSIRTLGNKRMKKIGLTPTGAWKPPSAAKSHVRILLYLSCLIGRLYSMKFLDELTMCFYKAAMQPITRLWDVS